MDRHSGHAQRPGHTRLQEILSGTTHESIHRLIAADMALEPQANAIASVDKLVRFHRDLYRLLNNFVAFRDFYGRDRKAVFQAGTLYLDRRSCNLCLRVDDPAKHATLAGLSRAYLAYCDLTRKGSPDKMTIAAAFTNGDSDNLMVGRNGIFYDRQGRDWDATITKIVEQPKINLPFGASLTGIAKLPPNCERNLSDPFAEKKSGRNWLIAFLVLVIATGALWYFGVLNQYFPTLSQWPARQNQEQSTPSQPPSDSAPAP